MVEQPSKKELDTLKKKIVSYRYHKNSAFVLYFWNNIF